MSFWKDRSGSPYLKANRLADVLAAIQTMAVYGKYRATCTEWADRISGDSLKVGHWRTIFDEHPEFFRPSSYPDNYALALRRAQPRRFHRGKRQIISDDEWDSLSPDEKQKVDRPPLTEGQIKLLTDSAINLHGREIDVSRDWRWWVAPALSFFASLVGAIVGFAAVALYN